MVVVPAVVVPAAVVLAVPVGPETAAGAVVEPRSRLSQRLVSVREGRLLAGPETLQINLQNACNLNCVFCWNHAPSVVDQSPAWQRERLSDAHLQSIIAALPQLQPDHVLLSGRGEPLLHPSIVPLLAALQREAIEVTVQTNGVAGPPPEQLVELGVRHLVVNVSAAVADSYERIHPGRGHLFDVVVERLMRLGQLAAASRSPSQAPRVTLTAVIQRMNTDELLPLVELAARVGAAAVQLRGLEIVPELSSLRIDASDRPRILGDLERAAGRARELGLLLDDVHLRCLLAAAGSARGHFTADRSRGPCFMGWYYLRVTCDGRVMFCCKDKLVDHLDRRSLYRIWRSPAYQLLRVGGRDGDVSVGLFDDKCRACSNFARNEAVTRELAAP